MTRLHHIAGKRSGPPRARRRLRSGRSGRSRHGHLCGVGCAAGFLVSACVGRAWAGAKRCAPPHRAPPAAESAREGGTGAAARREGQREGGRPSGAPAVGLCWPVVGSRRCVRHMPGTLHAWLLTTAPFLSSCSPPFLPMQLTPWMTWSCCRSCAIRQPRRVRGTALACHLCCALCAACAACKPRHATLHTPPCPLAPQGEPVPEEDVAQPAWMEAS